VPNARWGQISIAVVCALIVGLFLWTAGFPSGAAGEHYNRLVDGFRSGHLYLQKEVPPGLAQLADPYNPQANFPYRGAMYDLSFYRGKLYLYFGITPALILFWPWVAASGHYLSQATAVGIFCAVGFLASVGLLRAARIRHFPRIGAGVVAAGALALGLCSGVRVLLQRPNVWEVPISCAYALTLLALGALWRALHESNRRGWWLALASVAYGLAIGARPSLAFGAVILLAPAAQRFWASRSGPLPLGLLAAAVAPIGLVVAGLMVYNYRRFGNPLEFGTHYQFVKVRQDTGRALFSLRYLWFNFRVYFLEPVRWSSRFPYAGAIVPPAVLPAGHAPEFEGTYGVLSNLPLTCLALAAPLACRGGSPASRSTLRWFLAAVAALFGAGALSLLAFYGSLSRYEVDFLPALILLAVFGVLGLEDTLAEHRFWRNLVRCAWVLLLIFSTAFTLLAGVAHRDMLADNEVGGELLQEGRYAEAIAPLESALWVEPDYAHTHVNLGFALDRSGRTAEAAEQFQLALRIEPDFPSARYGLGMAWLKAGRPGDAALQFEKLAGTAPEDPAVRTYWGLALARAGRPADALAHFQEAARLNPRDADARYFCGMTFLALGRPAEATQQFRQALQIRPDHAGALKALAGIAKGTVP